MFGKKETGGTTGDLIFILARRWVGLVGGCTAAAAVVGQLDLGVDTHVIMYNCAPSVVTLNWKENRCAAQIQSASDITILLCWVRK